MTAVDHAELKRLAVMSDVENKVMRTSQYETKGSEGDTHMCRRMTETEADERRDDDLPLGEGY